MKPTVTKFESVYYGFQSAGRIIGWLKPVIFHSSLSPEEFQSAGRIIGWLKRWCNCYAFIIKAVSIRRADYWLVEVILTVPTGTYIPCFNPPGGLLVG